MTPIAHAPVTASADDLLADVLDLAIASPLALDALVTISTVDWSTGITTACVECAHRPRLLLNPDFVREWCGTRERLAMLLLHELSHISLGHTRLYPRVTPEQNVAFDAVINASLLRGIAAKGLDHHPYAALFESYYSAEDSPFFLLRPPPGWPFAPDWSASEQCDATLRSIHQRLYAPRRGTSDEVTYTQIILALRGTAGFTDGGGGITKRLLGAHGQTDEELSALSAGRDANAAEVFGKTIDALAGISDAAAWGPRGPQRVVAVDTYQVQRVLLYALAKLLKSVVTRQDTGTARRRLVQTAIVSVDPSRDRRAPAHQMLAERFGAPTRLLFSSHIEEERPDRTAATIYLDVSGSMNNVLGPLHAALVSLRSLIAPEVLQFSGDVAPLSHADFVNGTVRTTGGTDITPVLLHAARRGNRQRSHRSLVLTDGYFDMPSGAAVQELLESGQQLHIAVAGDGPLPQGPWVASATRLPNIQTGRNVQ